MNIAGSLVEKLDRLPPILCRMMAERNGRFVSDVALARELKWGLRRLRRTYRTPSFANITVGDADAFIRACGLTWSSQRRTRSRLQYLGMNVYRMRHLRHRTGAEAAMIARHKKQFEKTLRTLCKKV